MELAIVPSFVGDDLIYDPRNYPSAKTLSLPSEHFLLGLVTGESSVLVMTWQEAMPSVQLALADRAGKRSISAVRHRRRCRSAVEAPASGTARTYLHAGRDVAIS
jgi:hypothetical protein